MMEPEPVYVLHATAIVGCGISLFFCVLTIITVSFFRPRTESMVIKKHLTIALSVTQVIFIVATEGYKSKIGCRVLSVLMHYTGGACFSWCAIDALGLYFFHANTSPKIRSTKFYLCVGWGVPSVILVLTLLIGFLDATKRHKISLYTCWSSDHVIWAFIVSSILIALVNIIILCVILRQLRHPSYDISPKAVIEKRGTRYGLRTNSLMLLGLCLGWIFAVMSFRDGNNLRYQLTFGLVNGLQGIFLFFFHCLLNADHVKGYMNGSKGAPEESGVSPESNRSKRSESQTSSKRKAANRTSKLENVPLISVSPSSKPDDKTSPTEGATDQQDNPQIVQDESAEESDENEKLRQQSRISLDHDIIPQLPGTPDPHIEHHESFSKKMVKIEKKIDLNESEQSRSKRPKTADSSHLQVSKENDNDIEKRRKSSSEPTISSGQFGSTKGHEQADRETPAKQRRSPKPHVSINELESLFSRTDCFTKPHCSSLSSLPRRERRISYEERYRKISSSIDTRPIPDQPTTSEESTSRTPSRNTQETLL